MGVEAPGRFEMLRRGVGISGPVFVLYVLSRIGRGYLCYFVVVGPLKPPRCVQGVYKPGLVAQQDRAQVS